MRHRKFRFDEMEGALLAPWEDGSSNRRDLQGALKVLRFAMDRELTVRQRQCLELCVLRGMTQKEAGALLGINKATVCRHLKLAKARLKQVAGYYQVFQGRVRPDGKSGRCGGTEKLV